MSKWLSTIALAAVVFLAAGTAWADGPVVGGAHPGSGSGGSTEMVNPDLTGGASGGTGAAPAGKGKVVVTPSPAAGAGKGKAEKPPDCPYTDIRSVKEAYVTKWRLVATRSITLPTGATGVVLVFERDWWRRADVFHCRRPKGHGGVHAGDVVKDEWVRRTVQVEVAVGSGGSGKPGPHWTDGLPVK